MKGSETDHGDGHTTLNTLKSLTLHLKWVNYGCINYISIKLSLKKRDWLKDGSVRVETETSSQTIYNVKIYHIQLILNEQKKSRLRQMADIWGKERTSQKRVK